MAEQCVRCIVQLHIARITWPHKDNVFTLEGNSVFIRTCLMGQIQNTDLFQPTFPIVINRTLSFDRIFTNCKVPSLLPEVLRGEHVKIELIQINENQTGGRIIARYENSASTFLFAERNGCSQFQLIMNKSRHYETPPLLLLSVDMSLSEAVVKSPVKLSRQLFGTDPADVLEASLDSTHQHLKNVLEKSRHEQGQSSIEKMQPDGRWSSLLRSPRDKSSDKSSHDRSHDKGNNSTIIDFTSDHSWKECPRRSCHKHTTKTKTTTTTSVDAVPFIVGRPDPSLMAKRDFCTCSPHKDKSMPVDGGPVLMTPPSCIRKTPPRSSSTPKASTLYSKYLDSHGNQRCHGDQQKPISTKICDKLNDLVKEISHNQKEESYALNENNFKGNTSHIRELSTIGGNGKNDSSFHDNDSLLTRIGPRDYWCKKMAEYSGKPHRIVFDETLEKIYKRLYDNS